MTNSPNSHPVQRNEAKIREALNAAYYLLMDDHRTVGVAYDLADVIKRYDDTIKFHVNLDNLSQTPIPNREV